MTMLRFLTLNPGHFHAALVQKMPLPDVDTTCHVYGRLTSDLLLHLQRIEGFNNRAENPTQWEVEVHACENPLERLLAEKPGNVVVLAGFNRIKIQAIKAAVDAGLHVLSDKPWVIHPDDLPVLEGVLKTAEEKNLIAYDIMTERYEITTMLQKELINDSTIFGEQQSGTADEPGVYIESIHYLMKLVAGRPLQRPVWYFDIDQQGEGLSDVGTHLVDLIPWMCFPEQTMTTSDIQIVNAKRWPTVMSKDDFEQVTGTPGFPESVSGWVEDEKLNYYCNTQVTYQIRGVTVKLDVLWHYKAGEGEADKHFASFRGSRSRVEIRQGAEQGFRPELYVVPNDVNDLDRIGEDLQKKIADLQSKFAGIKAEKQGNEWRVTIPDTFRVGHEAHFSQVAQQFFRFVRGEDKLPTWENPNMLAKYFVTTKGVEKSWQSE